MASLLANSVESWVKARGADATTVMNLLQEHGAISDNCIDPSDIGNDKQAMMWLAKNFERFSNKAV